jgi:LPS sulfotransferase NodH
MYDMYDAYIICATPRSGSTLLCGMLAQTGVAGQPDSFFRSQSTDWWAKHWGLPDRTKLPQLEFERVYLAATLREGKAATPLFGMRLMQESLDGLCNRLAGLFPGTTHAPLVLQQAFGRTLFIHLTRGDKLAQAVSRVRAEQSGLWHRAPDGSEIERLGPPQPLRYDPQRIGQILQKLKTDDQNWNEWFTRCGITPLRLTYEALSHDPAAAVAEILRRLGQDPVGARDLSPPVAKLSDQINRDWITRFRAAPHPLA